MKYFKIDKNENKIIINKTKSYNVNSDIIDLLIDLKLEKDNYKNRLDKALQLSNEGLTEDYLNSIEDEFYSDYSPRARDIVEGIHKKYGDILRGEDND